LSIGGGFLGANADDTLDFFLVDAAGGAGKSEELDKDGYADGIVGAVVPLSFRAWAFAAAYGFDDVLEDDIPPPNDGKLDPLKSGAAREEEAPTVGTNGFGPPPNDGKLSLFMLGARVVGIEDEYEAVKMGVDPGRDATEEKLPPLIAG
jgi:hypothetical protein